MHIIVVDDKLTSLHLLQRLLMESGNYKVTAVDSAFQAFALLGLESPEDAQKADLILMDIFMPGMNGIEACSKIKASPHLKDIPIILMTAQKDTDMLEAAFKAGAMDYILKPLQKVELLARIRSALALKEEMDRRKAREQELLRITRKLEEAYAQLKQLSSLDGLTGIANRRYFDEYFEVEWRRAQREENPFSLIMADIDLFKAYNDNYGHLAGDTCLKQVASCMQSVIKRPGDLVARYGGEEFVVVLPETDLKGATMVAEEMRGAVEALMIPHAHSTVINYITISLGVAMTIPPRDGCREDLIKLADQALYQAKQGGRNRVFASSSDN